MIIYVGGKLNMTRVKSRIRSSYNGNDNISSHNDNDNVSKRYNKDIRNSYDSFDKNKINNNYNNSYGSNVSNNNTNNDDSNDEKRINNHRKNDDGIVTSHGLIPQSLPRSRSLPRSPDPRNTYSALYDSTG